MLCSCWQLTHPGIDAMPRIRTVALFDGLQQRALRVTEVVDADDHDLKVARGDRRLGLVNLGLLELQLF